jgi:hypothetical protein
MDKLKGEHDASRRAFVKKASYVAPAILTLQAFSSVAKAGSYNDVTTPVDTSAPTGRRRRRR